MVLRGISSGLSSIGSLFDYNMANYIQDQKNLENQFREQVHDENLTAWREEQNLQAERDRALDELLKIKGDNERAVREAQLRDSPQYWVSGIMEDVGETKSDIQALNREIDSLRREIESLKMYINNINFTALPQAPTPSYMNAMPGPDSGQGPLNYKPTNAQSGYTGSMSKPSSGIPEGFWGLPNGEDFGLSNDVWDLFDSTNTP